MNSFLKFMMMLCLVLPSPALADDTEIANVLREELKALTSSVEKLTKQLETSSRQHEDNTRLQKLDLAIAYLNFRSRRIESIEREVNTQNNIRSRLEENIPLIEDRIREIEARMQEYPQGPPDELRESYEGLTGQREIILERISRIDDQLVMKENLMYELQSQIRDVEDFVQRNLEM